MLVVRMYCIRPRKYSHGKAEPTNLVSIDFTDWRANRKSYGNRTVLVVWGGEGEHHELAVSGGVNATIVEGSGVKIGQNNGATILNWQTSSSRRVVSVGYGLYVYILGKSQCIPRNNTN